MMNEEKNGLTDLKSMQQVDPKTVDKETLVDIHDVKIRMDLDKRERVQDYIRQIKNPYCYLDNGTVIKVSFTGERTLEECLKDFMS